MKTPSVSQAPLAVAVSRGYSGREAELSAFGVRSRGFQWDSDHPFKPTGSNRRPLL